MPYERIRVLIWGKTYPELSSKYVETVCTGGVREDGRPIRLYPVPLRYLDTDRQYKLYDWIDVEVDRNSKDSRPESFRVRADRIQIVNHLETRDNWRDRRDVIFREPSWQFDSVAALQERQKANAQSMGIVTPGVIEDVKLQHKPKAEGEEYAKRMKELQSQSDLFHPQYRDLEFLPYHIQLSWRCIGACDCRARPHSMSVLDWGLLQLARRDGWDKARDRLRAISNLATHDFRLFMGNFRLRPWVFGVIGLWYPMRPPAREQQELELL